MYETNPTVLQLNDKIHYTCEVAKIEYIEPSTMTELNLVHQMQLISTEQCKQIWTHTSSPSPSSYIIISRDVFQHLSTSWTTHLNDPTDPHDKARGRTVVPVVLFMLRFIAKPRTFCPKTAGAKQFWQKHCQCGRWKKMVKLSFTTLQGTNMSHVGGKNSDSKVIFDEIFSGIC